MKLLSITINNKKVLVPENLSVLQACDNLNITVPRFCFHPFLSIAGNCRMCLVQIENMPKLQVSCAISITPEMIIKTNSLAVLKSREGILELLLINHPLDCAICDASSECDLQDQSMFYGSDKSKFKEFKRAVEDKNCSPLIKTVMTRCILCTRCVRFANEILGLSCLGSAGRGNSLEISTFINKLIFSELSGNLIDICPVGALTAKSYRFLARSWELNTIESIDLFDCVHSNIRIDLRGYEILRVLPRFNEFINDVWISDKIRFAFDGMNVQRLAKPILRINNSFKNVFWFDIINYVYDLFDQKRNLNRIGFCIGTFLDIESLILIKHLANKLNAVFIDNCFNNSLCLDFETEFRFNFQLKNIAFCDFCCFLGANPIKEAAILNFHVRKRFIRGNLLVALLGSNINFNLPYAHLGVSLSVFFDFIEGKHLICKNFQKSNKPMIIFGKSFLNALTSSQVNIFISFLKQNFNYKKNDLEIANFLCTKTSDFSKYFLGLQNIKPLYNNTTLLDVLYVFGNIDVPLKQIQFNFTIVQSHHGSLFAQQLSNVVLPCYSFFENTGFYFNLESIIQRANKVTTCIGDSFANKEILFLYYYYLSLENFACNFKYIDNLIPLANFKNHLILNSFFSVYDYHKQTVFYLSFFSSSSINNFYNADIVSNFSVNMLKCSKSILNRSPFVL